MKQPVHYSEEIATTILARLSDGESLTTICKAEGMPTRRAIHQWVLTRDDFSNRYHQACQIKAMGWADEILDIADGEDPDPMRRRLRVDTRKWLLSKMLPKVYGDRVTLAGDADNPIRLDVAALRERVEDRVAGIATRLALPSPQPDEDDA